MKTALKIIIPAVLLLCIFASVPFIPPAAGDWLGWGNYLVAEIAIEAAWIVALAGIVILASRKIDTPSLWAIGAIVVVIAGGATGAKLMPPEGTALWDPYYMVAHFRYVMRIGAVFMTFAGFYYWFPRITSFAYRPILGQFQLLLSIVAVGLEILATHVLLPSNHLSGYSNSSEAFTRLSLISTAEAWIAAGSVLVFLIMLADALIRRVPASD